MKYLLEHDRTAKLLHEWASPLNKVTVHGFFFWAAGNEKESSQIGLLQSLLHQILLEHPELAEQVEAFRDHTSNPGRPWTHRELQHALHTSVAEVTRSNGLAFFIDGLDEFQGDVGDLIDTLNELNRLPRVKLCVCSRPWNVFHSTYGSTNDELCLDLPKLTRNDIDTYIGGRLESLPGFKRLTPADAHEITVAIRDKAEGVFLWVTLVVNRLRNAIGELYTAREMLETLQATPSELDTLLQQIFEQIDLVHRKAAARTFLSILNVYGIFPGEFPLRWLSDLNSDAQSGSQKHTITLAQLQELDETGAEAARRWCRDLVDVQRQGLGGLPGMLAEIFHGDVGVVTFPHRTVHDFILAKEADGTLQRYAGDLFCPHFVACSVLVRHARGYALLEACKLSSLSNLVVELVDSIKTSLDSVATVLLTEFNSFARALSQEEPLSYWTFYNDFLRNRINDILSVKGLDGTAVHMSSMLYHGRLRSFRLILNVTPQCVTKDSKMMWCATLLFHGVAHTDGIRESLAAVLQLGVDVNEPWSNLRCSGASTWTLWLLYCHSRAYMWKFDVENWKLVIEVLDTFLQYGADPDASLPTRLLLRFLHIERDEDGAECIHRDWDDCEQCGSSNGSSKDCKTCRNDASESKPGESAMTIDTARELDSFTPGDHDTASKRKQASGTVDAEMMFKDEDVLPATAAFELPDPKASLCNKVDKEGVAKCFPIMKAKLIAASQAKAATAERVRAQQIRDNPPTWMAFAQYL